jgi:hypothetical protein
MEIRSITTGIHIAKAYAKRIEPVINIKENMVRKKP